MKPGATHASQPIDDEVRNLAVQVKSEVEQKTGKQYGTYEPKEYAKQVVNGTNFFVKVDVGDSHIHVRIYRDLKQNVSVHSVQEGKSASDPVVHF